MIRARLSNVTGSLWIKSASGRSHSCNALINRRDLDREATGGARQVKLHPFEPLWNCHVVLIPHDADSGDIREHLPQHLQPLAIIQFENNRWTGDISLGACQIANVITSVGVGGDCHYDRDSRCGSLRCAHSSWRHSHYNVWLPTHKLLGELGQSFDSSFRFANLD